MRRYIHLITALIILLNYQLVDGQAQTWRWNFGNNAALFFAGGGAPVATAGSAMTTFEGCASIGTASGALAFYTDGAKVWNANNVIMANGTGLFGTSSTTQAAIIVPRPGSSTQYYIFCSSSNFSPGTLSYSLVDMTLNSGLGDVTATKNVVVQNNIAEKLTAVRHCNGVDVWVICHDYTNSNYYAFLVTSAGVSTTPVTSSAGAPCSGNVVGVIKSSPNGQKIAYCASNGPFALHVADFNNSTGVVSNAINLAGNAALQPMYGLEFSPDSKILYGSKWAGSNQVYQWDLCQTTTLAVVNSALMVGSGSNTHGQMQLGPNGKIYIARAGAQFLAVINNPNTLGTGCNYVANGVSTAPGTSQYGLPTFIQSYLKVPPPPFTSTMSCLVGSFTAPSFTALNQGCITTTTNPIQSYLWNFGDPSSGPTNTSTISNPTHIFSGPGTYTVKLVLGYACGGDTITGTVTAISCGPSVLITGQSICPGSCTTLSATASGGTGPYSYTWTPNLGSGPGPFTVCPNSTTIYSVIVSDVSNTTANDTAIVTINPVPTVAVTSPTACTNDSFTLTANGGTAYAWVGPNSFTSNVQNPVLNNVSSTENGNYTVTVTSALGCTNTAVANASVIPLPVITIAGSMSLCSQNFNGSINTITLSASGITTYSWSTSGGLSAPANMNTSPITFTANPTSIPTIETLTLSGSIGSCSNTITYTVAIVPNPTITVTSASMCAGTSTMLVASNADTFTWSGPNLSATTGASVTANPSVTTIYSVYGSSLNCNSATEASTVDVLGAPSIAIVPGTATVCSGSGVGLSAVGATSYTWYPATSLNTTNGPAVIASPLSTTEYTVIGTQNTCTSSAVAQVSVITLPNVFATASQTTICAGENVNINANGATSYSWSPSAGLSNPFSNFISITPNASVVYTVTGQNGICAGFATVAINVIPLPNLELSTNLNRICRGNHTTIYASGAQSYNWKPDTNMTLLSPETADVYPTESTNYTVTGYNTVDGHSCTFTKELMIEVVPQVTAVVGGTYTICQGESVRLNASGGVSYAWLPVQGLENATIANPYASPTITTVYTVNVSNAGYCGGTGTLLVKVNPTPTVYAGEDFVINLDEPIYLNGVGQGTLTWISGDGILCPVCPNTQIMPKNSGNYIIQAVTQFGCKAQDEVHVEVTKDHNIYIPNVFTPNDDGVNDVFLVYGTGIVEIEMNIFDRWGEKLYTSKDQLKGWNGYYKGELCKNDAYVYKITYKGLDGKNYTKTGHVTLMK